MSRSLVSRRRCLAFVIGGVVWSGGCSSSSPSAVDPHSPEARHIAGLFWLMLWISVGIYLLVLGFVVASFRGRARAGRSEQANEAANASVNVNDWIAPAPATARDRRRSQRLIVGGGIVLPVIVLAIVGVATVRTTNVVQPESSIVRVDVRAERWWWRLTYPDDRVVTANEIHVPSGEPVDLTLTSDNVVHSVWVPELNGKTDAIPGQTNHLTFTADTPGTYRGQCAEFCGLGHALMAFVVIVQTPAEYSSWLEQNALPAARPTAAAGERGAAVFARSSCAGCHTVRGTTVVGSLGPDLTHFGSLSTIAAAIRPNTPADLTGWLADTQGVKRGALMPQIDLTDDQIADLVAYLEGLT